MMWKTPFTGGLTRYNNHPFNYGPVIFSHTSALHGENWGIGETVTTSHSQVCINQASGQQLLITKSIDYKAFVRVKLYFPLLCPVSGLGVAMMGMS